MAISRLVFYFVIIGDYCHIIYYYFGIILLRSYLLKTFKYEFVNCKPSREQNVFLFQLNSLLSSLFLCHYSHLTHKTIIITKTACPAQLFVVLLITATILFELHTQLVTGLLELQLTNWLLYFAFSLTTVEMEGSCSHLLEQSAAIVCISMA